MQVQSGERDGAFSGFCCILHTSNGRAEAFKRLIELGKGRVIASRPPYTDHSGATHCLAEPSKLPNVSECETSKHHFYMR